MGARTLRSPWILLFGGKAVDRWRLHSLVEVDFTGVLPQRKDFGNNKATS